MPSIRSNQHVEPGEMRTINVDRVRNPVDVHVGSRVRMRRVSVGMSKDELGEAVGVSDKVMGQYESGEARIGAKLLYELCILLNCSATLFFEDL